MCTKHACTCSASGCIFVLCHLLTLLPWSVIRDREKQRESMLRVLMQGGSKQSVQCKENDDGDFFWLFAKFISFSDQRTNVTFYSHLSVVEP